MLAHVGARLLLAESGSEEELLRLVPGADAILTCFKQVPASVVRAGEKLQVIGRYGIGIDNIAVEEATRLGIPVTNVPAYCLDEVAEHALALLLAGARSIVRYDRAAAGRRLVAGDRHAGLPRGRSHAGHHRLRQDRAHAGAQGGGAGFASAGL